MPYRAFSDRTGERYGRLLILSYAGILANSRAWVCLCDCGTEKVITWKQLEQNHARSCGCLQREARQQQSGWNRKGVGVSAFNQLYSGYKKSARERGHVFELDEDTFRVLTQSNCYYCGRAPYLSAPRAKGTNGDYIYNGIDRIDSSKGYITDNVRPCCKQCNIAKGVLTEQDFFDWIVQVAAYTAARQARFEHGEKP